MIKPTIRNLQLATYEVLEDNPAITSQFFGLEVNSYFTVGVWSFFLNPPIGPFYYLKPETAILSELVDFNGNPIWIDYPTSPKKVSYGADGSVQLTANPDGRSYGYFLPTDVPQRLLASVNVFEDVAIGPAKLTLLGVATSEALRSLISDQTKADSIDKWDGYYNIKYQTTIEITRDKNRKNSSPLVFKTKPTADIVEINQYYYEDFSTPSTVTVSGSAEFFTATPRLSYR